MKKIPFPGSPCNSAGPVALSGQCVVVEHESIPGQAI